jgi:Tol biopolymer transport system component
MSDETIFATAVTKKTASERQAYLDEACAGNWELRAAVEELLRADSDAGSFLRHAPAGLGVTAEATVDGPEASGCGSASLPLLEPCDKPDRIGKLVGKVGEYEIIEVVGSGGMGTVLRAFDTKLSRVVAVKVIAPELAANAEAVKRFLREAQAAAAVVHDHVVTIHAVDESHQPPFLVMQFIDGQTLQQKIEREGALELKHILRIGSQAAAGLAAAHKTGLIHRDVKPSNILLENGVERVKITDFGLARAADDLEATKTGLIAGTPQYMSPEQAKGEPIDARSDLFSLGSVLYTMCTGRPAFRAETTMGVLRRVCDDAPRPIREVNVEIPEWLEAIVGKLLAKSPTDRFQSAGEVAELLSQHLAHVQHPAVMPQPVGWDKLAERAPAHQRGARVSPAIISRRWSIAAAAVLLLSAALALAETTGVTNVTATVIRIVRGDGTLVVEVDDPNIQVLLDGEELVITGAGPKELRLRPGQHELQTVKGGKPTDTKLITITRDGRQIVKVAREQPAPAPQATRLVWADAATGDGSVSPDGRRFAFVDWDTGDLAVRDLETGKNRRLTNKGTWSESSAFANSPKFSADGTQLAYTWYDTEGGASLRVLAVDGGEPITLHSHKDIWAEAYGWSPDGKTILAGLDLSIRSQLQIALIGVTDRTVRILKSFDGGRRVGRISLAPNGRTIAYSRPAEPESVSRSIFLLDVESGQETRATTHAANSDVFAWTTDGRRLVFTVERQQTLDAWATQIADGKPQGAPQLVKADLGIVSPLGFTGDGKLYYGLTFAQPSAYIAALDLEKETVAATPLPGELFSVMDQLSVQGWSPDGQYLAYTAKDARRRHNEIRVLSVKDGQTRALQPDLRDLYGFYWSPDGKSFVIRSRKQDQRGTYGIYQIDASTGNVTTILEPLVTTDWANPQWSPDGRGIFCGKGKNGIFYLDVPAKSEREILAPGNAVFTSRRFAVSPDGRHLAVLGIAKDTGGLILRLLPVDGGAARDLLTDDQKTGLGWVTWTPDRKFLLFTRVDSDEKLRGLWYIAVDGAKPHKLEVTGIGASRVVNMAVHPNGKQLAVTTSAFKRCEVWALENFLPPLKDSAASAAAVAAADKSKSAASADNASGATAGSASSTSTAAEPNPKSVPDPAVIQALRDLVAAKERSLKTAQGRFDSKVGTRLEVLAAEIDHLEARIRLAEAERQNAAVLALLKDLVAERQEVRRLLAQMVKKGVATPDELNHADARLAEASARLAQANSNHPATSEVPQP